MTRKTIALGIFAIGFIAAILFVPIESCRGIGYRGVPGKNFRCDFEKYYLVTDVVTEMKDFNRGGSRSRRIAHGTLLTQLLALGLFCTLLGLDYSRLLGGADRKN